MEKFYWSKLILNKNEAATKSTLIKYILGIKDSSSITVEQLKCLTQEVIDGTDQNYDLKVFLESITDFEEAASWLSKNAYSFDMSRNLLGIIKHPKGKRGL